MDYVKLHGLDLTDDFKDGFESKIDTLLESAPSDATASSLITRRARRYVGVLNVFSQERKFTAHAASQNLQELGDALIGKIQLQLKDWRARRFKNESREQLSFHLTA